MDKWEDLKVYKLLKPEEIPKAFKHFANLLADKLKDYDFELSQSKTVKKFFPQLVVLEMAFSTQKHSAGFSASFRYQRPTCEESSVCWWQLCRY